MNQLETARKALADITARRDGLETRKLALEAQRDAVAYDALTGDKKASVKLAETIREIVTIDGELAAYAAGLRVAEQKLQRLWAPTVRSLSGRKRSKL